MLPPSFLPDRRTTLHQNIEAIFQKCVQLHLGDKPDKLVCRAFSLRFALSVPQQAEEVMHPFVMCSCCCCLRGGTSNVHALAALFVVLFVFFGVVLL